MTTTTKDKIAPICFAAGFAIVMNCAATVEWSVPYCNDPQDGSLGAAFGFPLPYVRFTGASSFLYAVAPHVLAINLLLVALLAYPLGRVVFRGRGDTRSPWARLGRRALAFGLAAGVLAGLAQLAITRIEFVRSIAHEPYDSIAEMRPVAVSVGFHYDCAPSTFWFPPHWEAPASSAVGTPPDHAAGGAL